MVHLSLTWIIRVCSFPQWFHLDGIKSHVSHRPERFNRRDCSAVVLEQNQTMTRLGLHSWMWKSDVRSNPNPASFFNANIIYAGKALWLQTWKMQKTSKGTQLLGRISELWIWTAIDVLQWCVCVCEWVWTFFLLSQSASEHLWIINPNPNPCMWQIHSTFIYTSKHNLNLAKEKKYIYNQNNWF